MRHAGNLLRAICLSLVGLNGVARAADGMDAEHSLWHFTAYVDVGHAFDIEHARPHRWRSRGTGSYVNEVGANVGLLQLRKDVDQSSRWGMELGFQSGWDTEGQLPAEAPGRDRALGGADVLRHLARANASYLLPVGEGVLMTAGLFNSFIGYESFYARDNFNYTRTYIAENSPYFLFGAGLQYPLSATLKGGLYLLNGYNYLSHPNNLPSYGGQLSWVLTPAITINQNVYAGPDQKNTRFAYWRFFSDTNLQWTQDRLTLGGAVDFGTERMAERAGGPRAWWLGGAVYSRWKIDDAFSVAVRPEVYWDPNGRLTGAEQFIKAVTTTLEYKTAIGPSIVRWRLEYRYDHSNGREGGYFTGEPSPLPNATLVHHQHLLLLALLWSYDK